MNGGVYLNEIDEDPKFDLDDDDSTFEEQILLDDFNSDEKQSQHSHHEHIQTEIVSIIDANSGENIEFNIEDNDH